MKDSMSNTDLRLILPELREAAEGTFIKNVYQYHDVFVLKVYKPGGGSYQILIDSGRRVHLTEYVRKAPRVPPKFCAVLRKYLRDKRLLSIEQHDFDRILVIEVGDEQQKYKLVVELFGTGNLLLLDPENTIFIALHYRRMKDRDVIPKAKYEFPPARGSDLLSIGPKEIAEILSDSRANIVRTLASRLNLDALGCEEICALAEVPPTLMVEDIDSTTLKGIQDGVLAYANKVRKGASEPCIVMNEPDEDDDEGPEYLTFLPFQYRMYEDLPRETFESFSKTVDEYFGVTQSELEDDAAVEAYERERQRLDKIIEKQQESIDNLEQRAEALRAAGELIYAHFTLVQDVLSTITKAREDGISWEEIISRIEDGKEKEIAAARIVKRIVPSKAEAIVDLSDTEVTLDIRLSAQDNASQCYDQAKKMEGKMRGARKQIERTSEKLNKLKEQVPEPETQALAVKKRKKRWYEKFRWFISSEGYLVLAGRDAKSNENLAKRQMAPNDVFLHAVIHGAPYTLIKVPEEAPGEQTLEEAAQFAVTFSRAWQDGQSAGEAYWVSPEQVSFTPPSGEYLPSGAVMIYGTKNYLRKLPVELSVGVILEDEHAIPVSGPPSAIEQLTDYHVRVIPGEDKKGQLVKDVVSSLAKLIPEEQKSLVLQIPQEDVMRVLPSGGGRVAG
jgi:predicted ribosome quality control (RQC) complex YloA/Tae2 family protein